MIRTSIPKVDPAHRGSAGWYLDEDGVNLVCGGCGLHIGVATNHTIEPDGEVNASIGCPYPRCDWHVWGLLLDWTPPEEP